MVGAGPTGLTAATYLARFRRRVLVLDGGPSRADWIPKSHNTPGFPQGIGGPELITRLRSQAQSHGATIQPGRVETLRASPQGFRLEGDFARVDALTVLLATGVVDHLPAIEGLPAAILSGRVRMCPICDGYEAIDRRLAVLGEDDLVQREADFLRTYSPDVTILRLGPAGGAAPAEATCVALEQLEIEPDAVVLRKPGEAARRFDHLYLALGCSAQAQLAVAAGARQDELGNLLVDAHQATTVDGLYAAGDVVRGLNQIAVGAGEAAIAATAIHNRLRSTV